MSNSIEDLLATIGRDIETATTESINGTIEDLVSRGKYDEIKASYKERRKVASRHTIRADVRAEVFEKHGRSCLKCGSILDIQIDHIVPVVKDGESTVENYQPLCVSCNSSKGGGVNNKNRTRIERYFTNNPGSTKGKCCLALSLSYPTVTRHIKVLTSKIG